MGRFRKLAPEKKADASGLKLDLKNQAGRWVEDTTNSIEKRQREVEEQLHNSHHAASLPSDSVCIPRYLCEWARLDASVSEVVAGWHSLRFALKERASSITLPTIKIQANAYAKRLLQAESQAGARD